MDRLASWPESELDFRQLGCPHPPAPPEPRCPLLMPWAESGAGASPPRPWVSFCPSMTLQPHRVPNWSPSNFFIPAVLHPTLRSSELLRREAGASQRGEKAPVREPAILSPGGGGTISAQQSPWENASPSPALPSAWGTWGFRADGWR